MNEPSPDPGAEDYSCSAVPQQATVSGWRIGIILIGIQITLPAFLVGAELGRDMGLTGGILVFVCAGLILSILAAVTGMIGVRTRLSTYMILNRSFGVRGALVVNAVIGCALLGWFGITAELFAGAMQSAVSQLSGIESPRWIYLVMGSALMIATTLFGFRGLDRLSITTVPLMLLFLFSLVFLALKQHPMGQLLAVQSQGISFGIACSAAVGGFIVGATLFPDICGFAKNIHSAWIASGIGLLLGFPMVLTLAAIPGIALQENEFLRIVMVLGLGVPGLLMLVVATWTTNASNLYSSSLALAAIVPKKRWILTVAAGVLGTAIALSGLSLRFLDFLVTLGVLIPPVAGVYIGDFCFRPGRTDPATGPVPPPALSITALVAWILGAAVGLLAVKGHITLSQIPSLDALAASFVIFAVLKRFPGLWQRTSRYNGPMSPTVFRAGGFRFFFSREEARPHVHIVSVNGETKFWLQPEIRLVKSYHYSSKQLRDIAALIEEHKVELIRAWQEHFGS